MELRRARGSKIQNGKYGNKQDIINKVFEHVDITKVDDDSSLNTLEITEINDDDLDEINLSDEDENPDDEDANDETIKTISGGDSTDYSKLTAKKLKELAKEKGLDGVFLGLRAEENKQRKIFLRKYSSLYFVQQKQIWYCNPIAWWSVYDVWAYILSNQIDYNKAYDKLSEINIAIDKQRIGPFANERALGYGQLAILKIGWPEEYQRFQEKYPEATAFV